MGLYLRNAEKKFYSNLHFSYNQLQLIDLITDIWNNYHNLDNKDFEVLRKLGQK